MQQSHVKQDSLADCLFCDEYDALVSSILNIMSKMKLASDLKGEIQGKTSPRNGSTQWVQQAKLARTVHCAPLLTHAKAALCTPPSSLV